MNKELIIELIKDLSYNFFNKFKICFSNSG